MTKRISVVMVVKNEEKHMKECLEKISWVDEIIIIDNGSIDKSIEFAKKYGAKIYKDYSPFNDFLYDKAIEQATGKWIFLLDPDERVTEELNSQIKQIVNSSYVNNEKIGYYIPFKHVFLWKWLRYGGWYPSYHLRLIKKNHAKIHGAVHDIFNINNKEVGYLSGHIIHYGDMYITQRVVKINLYSSIEAEEFFKQKKKESYVNLVSVGFIRFMTSYVLKNGFLDGIPGFIRAVFLFYTTFFARAKMYELNLNKKYK